jgi:hypothetical protein
MKEKFSKSESSVTKSLTCCSRHMTHKDLQFGDFFRRREGGRLGDCERDTKREKERGTSECKFVRVSVNVYVERVSSKRYKLAVCIYFGPTKVRLV